MANTLSISDQVVNSAYTYQQYYTSSDCSVFIEHAQGLCQPIILDKLNGIGFSEILDSQPIYGIGNQKFGFLTEGNLLVRGSIVMNFTHPNYLYTTLLYIANGGITPPTVIANPLDLNSVSNLTDSAFAQLATSTKNANINRGDYATSIKDYPKDFNFRVILNNGFLYKKDVSKIYVIKGVKITSQELVLSSESDAPIGISYQFQAREVSTATIG